MGKLLLIIILQIITYNIYSLGQSNHFIDPGYTGETYPIVIQEVLINGSQIEIGDEVAVFDQGPGGLGINKVFIYNGITPFTIFSRLQTIVLNDTLPGAIEGNLISFRVWDSSENIEYEATAVFSSGGNFGQGIATNVSMIQVGTTSVTENEEDLIPDFILYQNYPNPFNSSTILSFDLQKSGMVHLEIVDITGNILDELINQFLPEGRYKYTWCNIFFTSGVYLYQLKFNNCTLSKKIILLK